MLYKTYLSIAAAMKAAKSRTKQSTTSNQPTQTRHEHRAESQTHREQRAELWLNTSAIVRDRIRLRLGCLASASDGLWVLEICWTDISKILEEKDCTGGLTNKETSSS